MQPDDPMPLEVRFAADLYRGTAGYYDTYRLPYPETMLTDLIRRAGVCGSCDGCGPAGAWRCAGPPDHRRARKAGSGRWPPR